jgi:tetratricopeptide (TPR) repeat protein
LQIPANAILAVVLAAMLSVHWRFATERFWCTASWWSKSLASIALLAALAYLGNQELRLGREYSYLKRAAGLPTYSQARVDALKSAHLAEAGNFETSYKLGEVNRMKSFEGGENYVELANEAMLWYGRATNANPYEPLYLLRYGMCLDQIDKHDEAEVYFLRADELDPNGFVTAGLMGWHYIQRENYAAAMPWLERSRRLEWTQENKIALDTGRTTQLKARHRMNSRLFS